MSMSPNNPFEDPQNDQATAWDDPKAQPVKSKKGKGCLIGCGIVAVLGLALCCGGPILLVQFGVGTLATELARQLADDPAIVEHIGDIESFDVSWSATIEEAQKTGDQDAGLVFEIKGSKGSGRLVIKGQQGGGAEGIESAILILPDDTRIPIDVGPELRGGDAGVEEFDMGLEDLIDVGEVEATEPDEKTPAEEPAGAEN